MYDVSTVAVDY